MTILYTSPFLCFLPGLMFLAILGIIGCKKGAYPFRLLWILPIILGSNFIAYWLVNTYNTLPQNKITTDQHST